MLLPGFLLQACFTPPRGPEDMERPSPPSLTVLAAASLKETLESLDQAWEQGQLTLQFEASSKLARQVEAGREGDLFFSADREWSQYLIDHHLSPTPTPVAVAGNRLVAVVSAQNVLEIKGVGDLSHPEITRLGVAGETVPAGKYTDAALQHFGLTQALSPKMVRGDHVRTVLGWVAINEVDVGFVYATDAQAEARVKVAWTFPPESHPPIQYTAVMLNTSQNPELALQFLFWLTGPEGQNHLKAAGFTPLTPHP